MSDKKKFICMYGLPNFARGCNTTEDLARYLDSDPHPDYRLVSTNWMNGTWHLIFVLKDIVSEKIGEVSVDSGQLFIVDPCYIDSIWKREEFKDIRRYKHKTGVILEYPKDFKSYEENIIIDNIVKTMNQMVEDGDVEKIPLERCAANKMSYNACCIKTLSEERCGQVNLGVAFSSGYGDGVYPVYAERNKEGRIVKVTIEMD